MLKVVLFSIGLLFSFCSFAEEPMYPKLFFSYSYAYDDYCSEYNPVDEAWSEEAQRREKEFEKVWEDEAPQFFKQLFAEFGKGFSRREYTATLSVCPGKPSYSNPIVLKINPYLKSYKPDMPMRPLFTFADLVFHELLHTWIVENLKESALLLKYKNEDRSIRNHLHLMAVQILIYRGLERKDLLDWLEMQYPRMRGPYQRAWQIVNDEGYEAFIAELKK